MIMRRLRYGPSQYFQHLRDAVVALRLKHKLEEDVADDPPHQRPPLRQLGVDAVRDRLQVVSASVRKEEWESAGLSEQMM